MDELAIFNSIGTAAGLYLLSIRDCVPWGERGLLQVLSDCIDRDSFLGGCASVARRDSSQYIFLMEKKSKKRVAYSAYIVVFVFCLGLLELGSYFVIKSYVNKFHVDSQLIGKLGEAYDRVNHLNPLAFWHYDSGLMNWDLSEFYKKPKYSNIDEFIFTQNQSSYESSSPRKSLLIQGDSWAEQFTYYNMETCFSCEPNLIKRLENLERLEKLERNYEVMYAGTTSYSPSIMAAQFDLLVDWYDIKPEVVIAIVDQTDFGDEFCRYKDLRKVNSLTGRITVFNEANIFKIMTDNYLNFMKISKLTYMKLRYRLAERCLSNMKQIFFPLENGLTDDQEQYFIGVLSDYVKTVSHNHSVKKLIFVTHPHLNHLLGNYQLEMGRFIDQHLERLLVSPENSLVIKHISVKPPSNDYSQFFVDSDPTHLNLEAHSTHYLNAIVSGLD